MLSISGCIRLEGPIINLKIDWKISGTQLAVRNETWSIAGCIRLEGPAINFEIDGIITGAQTWSQQRKVVHTCSKDQK